MNRNTALTVAFVALVLALLVGLNLVFLSEPRREETEVSGDRSSYKATPYGTLAFYLFLGDSGRKVTRFEQPYTKLKDAGVKTLLVIVPDGDSQPSQEEFESLEEWVSQGGSLVVVDRVIELEFAGLELSTRELIGDGVKPIAVSMLTRNVGSLAVTPYATAVVDGSREAMAHVAGRAGAMVIDKAYGGGRMTFVTEPYVVQNNGIREKDNLALALNLVDGVGDSGVIAFDEFHHGRGRSGDGQSGLRQYVAGTPIPWVIAQLGLVALVIALSVGRRFGRPVPLAAERRTSALEFVSSMANIQRLAKASDLAVENIYSHFRARLCRYAGLPSNTRSPDLARAVALRGQIDEARLASVMRRCEDTLNGRELKGPDLVDLVAEVRRIEAELKL
jgi:hypothetical protein